tara:strand:+ start:646 stop:753 length:108 start_codon:yes stop_codon:yes gene_type:complete
MGILSNLELKGNMVKEKIKGKLYSNDEPFIYSRSN